MIVVVVVVVRVVARDVVYVFVHSCSRGAQHITSTRNFGQRKVAAGGSHTKGGIITERAREYAGEFSRYIVSLSLSRLYRLLFNRYTHRHTYNRNNLGA